jgi:hypothetical protein
MSAILRLLAAIVREQVGREGAEAESWRLAALAAREEYSSLSDALRQETRLSLALTEQRDEALAQLAAVREAIGEAWFAGGVDVAAAVQRKTAALERLSVEVERG